jgi:hypothetical protein
LRNWTTVLLNGTALILAGVLIFSIEWESHHLALSEPHRGRHIG